MKLHKVPGQGISYKILTRLNIQKYKHKNMKHCRIKHLKVYVYDIKRVQKRYKKSI